MKIALIESYLNGKGGSQRQALSFAVEFQKLGHDVTVYAVTHDKGEGFLELISQLKVISLPGGFKAPPAKKRRFFGFLNYIAYAKAENSAARALAYLIDRDTEILNPHDRLGFHVASYYKKCVKDVPSVLMMSDILTKSWIAWRKSQFDPHYRPSVKQKLFNWLVDAYEVRHFITPHEGMAVLDERTKQWAMDYFHKNATVVRSGLNIEKFSYVPRNAIQGRRVRILMAGIFFLHRRYEDGIRAVKLLEDHGIDASMTITGNYIANNEYKSYFKRLCSLVKELGLESRVTFAGEVSEDELAANYASHDIYVSPNHLQSWGLACFEAMARGLPAIVSKSAGAAEVLTNGENALLVSPRSPEEIVRAALRLINDAQLYTRISSQGRKFVEENISWEKSARAMLNVFERVRHA